MCGWVNSGVLFCFIINDKVKVKWLKGIEVEFFIIKVGGDNEKIIFIRYKFLLIDKRD